jgi:hypothetical protein
MTTRKRWCSKIYEDQFAPRLQFIEKSVQEQLSKWQYENMIMTYNLLKITFDRVYETMVNHTLWVMFIQPILSGTRFNQMVIILLVRALVNAINKEIWRAFLDKKHEVKLHWKNEADKKEKRAQRALDKAAKPAFDQIKEQVSSEVSSFCNKPRGNKTEKIKKKTC